MYLENDGLRPNKKNKFVSEEMWKKAMRNALF